MKKLLASLVAAIFATGVNSTVLADSHTKKDAKPAAATAAKPVDKSAGQPAKPAKKSQVAVKETKVDVQGGQDARGKSADAPKAKPAEPSK